MRILHIAHQYMPEYIGGTELYTRWVAEELSQRGHEVNVFYRVSDERTLLSSRVDVHNVRVWSASVGKITPKRRFLSTFGNAQLLKMFQQVITGTQPEVIHIQHLMGLPISLVNYIQQCEIPYIVTLHDYWWLCANAQLITNFDQTICDGPQAYVNCARCALARAAQSTFLALPPLMALLAHRNRLLHNVLTNATSIIAPSQFVADWYIAHNITAERITVLSHGLPLPSIFPERKDKKKQGVRFAYIGGLSWQKGVHILLEAFAGIGGNAELWIAGDETAEVDYVTQLRQLASPNVQFLGKLNRDEVWLALATVDAVVVPSLWYETFSFIVSEAFAMGVPVIASALGPLADRVRHGVDGFLFPPGDVVALKNIIQQLVTAPDRLLSLRKNILPVVSLAEHVSVVETMYLKSISRR